MTKIKFYNLKKINKKYQKLFIRDFKKINYSGKYINDYFVNKFEEKFSKYCGAKYCVAVGNCVDAIYLTFAAYKIIGKLKKNDEVIVPANTYIGSVLGVLKNNLKITLVEPNPSTFNIDYDTIKKKINKKTKAVLSVDLFGHPNNLKSIRNIFTQNKLIQVSDAAQSVGGAFKNKKVGSLSEVTCFSFFPGKNLGAFGDSGAIVTNNKKIYQITKSLRNYGEKSSYDYSKRKYLNYYKGVNSRMDEIQASVLINKLKDLKKDQVKREQIANYYLKKINNKNIILPYIKKNIKHAWHLFVIKSKYRNELKKYLLKNGIQTMQHYPIPFFKQKAFAELNKLKFPITQKLYSEMLSLPNQPSLSNKERNYIVKKINNFRLHKK